MTIPQRRPLEFQSLDEMLVDVENLHHYGYRPVGKWNLTQVTGHLGEWMRYPMDGFPRMPPPVRAMMWVLRNTIGKQAKRKILTTKTFAMGGPTIKESVPVPDGDEQEAISRFRDVVGRMKAYEGVLIPSPLFGPLTRDEWVGLSLIHAAHHLSFLLPKTS
ncbi:DUF1569 domain-containing protein [Zavarzinella formosa]|uniref:DUF1569 domain-containing protein n=1 Tax=Zavarzinella formosa TaxID=360055 RepID=UPI0002F3D5FD|nr:DUF1569 domain-containing protein [Zavarzinella formosa]